MNRLCRFLVFFVLAAVLVVAMFCVVFFKNVKKAPVPTAGPSAEVKTSADAEEKGSDLYKESDGGTVPADADALPGLLNAYYSGSGEQIAAGSAEPDLSDVLGWRDIDAEGRGVCFYADPASGGMNKFRGCICRTDDGGKSWFRAGESILGTGSGFLAWVDNTLVRFRNSEVTGRLCAETLKAADMRISDSEYLPVTFNDVDIYKAILGGRLPENVSAGAYADDRLLPVLLSNSGRDLLIGFQYYEDGYEKWQDRYEKKTEDGHMIQTYDGSNTSLPYCFIGKFNSDLEMISAVYEDGAILDRLAAYSAAQRSTASAE